MSSDITLCISVRDVASAVLKALSEDFDRRKMVYGMSRVERAVKESVDSYSQQGRAMSAINDAQWYRDKLRKSWKDCGDPKCDLCHPRPTAQAAQGTMSPSFYEFARKYQGTPIEFKLDFGMPAANPAYPWPTVAGPLTLNDPTGSKYFQKEEKSMSSSPTQNIINDLNSLAGDSSVDLSGVKRTIDSIEAERKRCIEKDLQGIVNMEIRKGTKAKRFVLVYFANNREYIVHGVAYPGYDTEGDEAEKKIEGYTVYLDASREPYFYNQHKTMCSLHQKLEDYNFPYRIVFFDKQ